jgi:hypothetical protein
MMRAASDVLAPTADAKRGASLPSNDNRMR